MWSPTDVNLSYLCLGVSLGATSLFYVLRHLNSNILKRDFQLPTIMCSQILAFLAAFIDMLY